MNYKCIEVSLWVSIILAGCWGDAEGQIDFIAGGSPPGLCCNGGGSSSEGRGSAHPTLPATLEKIGGLLPLFAYLSGINFLGDILSELVRYLKYKVICEFVCENLWGEVPGIMASCLLISFEISLIYIKLKKKRLKA